MNIYTPHDNTFVAQAHNFTPLKLPQKKLFHIPELPHIPRKLLLSFIVGVCTFGFLGWYVNTYIYRFFASSQVAKVTTSVKDISIAIGEEFTVTFNVKPEQLQDFISGAEMKLTYDPTYLEYGNGGATGFVPVSDAAYDIVDEIVDTDAGTVDIVLVNTSDVEYSSHQFSFLFRAKQDLTNEDVFALQNKVSVQLQQNPEFVGTAGGGAVEFESSTTAVTLATIRINADTNQDSHLLIGNLNPQITFKVRFQGIVGLPAHASTLQTKVTISSDKGGAKNISVPFIPQADGTWIGKAELKDISNLETFAFTLKGPKHLAKVFCEADPTETTGGTYRCTGEKIVLKDGENVFDFSKVIILAGDIPTQNGIIDAVDIVYIRQNLGNTGADTRARGDLNLDGIVDTQDYALVLAALGFKYDEE